MTNTPAGRVAWKKTRNRSRKIELTMMGTLPLLAAGCAQPPPPQSALLYQNLQQCVREGKVSPEVCAQAYADAIQTQYRDAPRYDSLAQCEAQFGYNQCHQVATASGDHWFMPALAGFLIGRALSPHDHYYGWGGYDWHSYARPGGPGGFSGQPIYRAYGDRGEWQTAQGERLGPGLRGPGAGVAQTLSRGGFGRSGAARFSWGG